MARWGQRCVQRKLLLLGARLRASGFHTRGRLWAQSAPSCPSHAPLHTHTLTHTCKPMHTRRTAFPCCAKPKEAWWRIYFVKGMQGSPALQQEDHRLPPTLALPLKRKLLQTPRPPRTRRFPPGVGPQAGWVLSLVGLSVSGQVLRNPAAALRWSPEPGEAAGDVGRPEASQGRHDQKHG